MQSKSSNSDKLDTCIPGSNLQRCENVGTAIGIIILRKRLDSYETMTKASRLKHLWFSNLYHVIKKTLLATDVKCTFTYYQQEQNDGEFSILIY